MQYLIKSMRGFLHEKITITKDNQLGPVSTYALTIYNRVMS